MKKTKEEAERWFKQAEYNLQVAQNNHDAKFYAHSCFMSEQTAQLALKAYIILKTGRLAYGIHSIKALTEKCVEFDVQFSEFIDDGKTLDKYYIPTRYTDALPSPSIPYETFTKKESEDAIRLAKKITELVKVKIKEVENK